jgi:hypothetical protein
MRAKDWPTLEIAVDEIKTIRDEAERMKLYAKQSKDKTMMADATSLKDRNPPCRRGHGGTTQGAGVIGRR